MTARPNFTVSGSKAEGDVPTVQADLSVAWEAPSGGSSSVLLASTNITSANLLAGDDVEMLPALGGRIYYVLHAILAHYRFGTSPYTGDFRPILGYGATRDELLSGGVFNLGLVIGPGIPASASLLNQTEDVYAYYGFNTNGVYNAWQGTLVEGKAITFSSDPEDFPLTDGDGSVTLRTWYSVIDGTPT